MKWTDSYFGCIIITAPGTRYYAKALNAASARAYLPKRQKPEADVLTYLCHPDTEVRNGWLIPPDNCLPILLRREVWKDKTVVDSSGKRITAKSVRDQVVALQRRRIRDAEREAKQHQKDFFRKTEKYITSQKEMRLTTYRANLLDEIEHEHALIAPDGESIKTSLISRGEARRRNTELKGYGYRWHLLRRTLIAA